MDTTLLKEWRKHMGKVTINAITADGTLSGGRGTPESCRYDPYRSALLDALRKRRGGPWKRNASLLVMEALDRLLMAEGLLPGDAPLMAEVKLAAKDGAP
jgi:hypothetical protein